MASDESTRTVSGWATIHSIRTALAHVAGVPELRTYYAAFLGLFAVVALYERAVSLLAADPGLPFLVGAGLMGVGTAVALTLPRGSVGS